MTGEVKGRWNISVSKHQDDDEFSIAVASGALWEMLFQHVRMLMKKRCSRAAERTRELSAAASSTPLLLFRRDKSLVRHLIHHQRLSPHSGAFALSQRETCSKVVIPVAKVGQRLSPAGWSRTQAQVCGGLPDTSAQAPSPREAMQNASQ